MFDHELFRRGKEDINSIAEMERFDADYRRQLHFNFSATRTTQKQKQALDATRASRLHDVDLDALPDNTSPTISSSKRQDLSRYISEDILNCPVGTPPPSAHLRLILREQKIFPATRESCRVYIGTGS